MPPAPTPAQLRARKSAATRKRNREEAEARAAEAEAERLRREGGGGGQNDRPDGPGGFQLPEEDGAAVTAGHLRVLQESMAAMVNAQDDRMAGVESQMGEVLALLRDGRRGNGGGAAENTRGDEDVPMRGQHGECPPISRRYGYIDEKLRGEAMAGTMDPIKLPLLLSDTSPLATMSAEEGRQLTWTLDEEGGLRAEEKKDTSAAAVARFVKAIPNAAVFAAAWGVFTDLVLHGLKPHDANTVAQAHSALRHYELWIIERSREFAWEGICKYHLEIARERRGLGFHCSQWYKNIDNDLWTRFHVRLEKRSGGGGSKGGAGSSFNPGAGSAGGSGICNNFNFGSCKGGCGRKHVCKGCGKGDHGVSTCKKNVVSR